MNRLINLPSTDTGWMCKMGRERGGMKSKLVVARGSTGPQRSGCRFRCGVLEWVYCLTSYFSLCPWIVICIYMYYRMVIPRCRSCGGRDLMVVGLTTTYACNQCISPLKLLVRIPQLARCTRYSIMWLSLSVICDRSVVFSGYSSFLCK
jgi:hypothetical protein